eukprot:TRINITY_DN237_c0_g1_i6.p1 TRINITY_DN237_c0_g1~~TRINITY_DN237_c0_g1_i6.p1  ORF type:complete len:837 (-),score=131.35 TRINITY_DN237_c0_g1_i6:715-2964(-)
MFWNVPGYRLQDSSIEDIISKDKFTLEELFEEDDLVQEAKAMNGRLVSFLKDKATLRQLVTYLVVPQEAYDNRVIVNDEDKDNGNENNNENDKNQEAEELEEESRKSKLTRYPYLACELICCEVEGILNNLVQNERLMNLLFSLLQQPRPINSTLAGYFGRVMSILLVKRTLEFMSYLYAHVTLLHLLIDHVDVTSVQEVVLRLIGADEQINMNLTSAHREWLGNVGIVQELVKRVSVQYTPETRSNAAEVLATIASTQPSLLAIRLSQQDIIQQMFNQALASKGVVLVPALGVFIALLSPLGAGSGSQDNVNSINNNNFEDQKVRMQAANGLAKYLPQIAQILDSQKDFENLQFNIEILPTTCGVLKPPLGQARLKAVELIAALVALGVPEILEMVANEHIVLKCMHVFQVYAFNNLLHQAIVTMLATGIELGSMQFVSHVFEECGLVQWMTRLPNDVFKDPNRKESGMIRAGYHGHITQLGMRLCHLASEHDEIKNLLEGHPEWPPFFVHILQPRAEKENVLRWACGRPAHIDTSMNSENSDQNDFQDGQDFDISMVEGYNPYAMLDQELNEREEEEDRVTKQPFVVYPPPYVDSDGEEEENAGILQPFMVYSQPTANHDGEEVNVLVEHPGGEANAVEVRVSLTNVHNDFLNKMEELHMQCDFPKAEELQSQTCDFRLQQHEQQKQSQILRQNPPLLQEQTTTISKNQQKEELQKHEKEELQKYECDFGDNKYWKTNLAFNFQLPD